VGDGEVGSCGVHLTIMQRIGRYILNGVMVVSLLLCVTTIVLWMRSYGVRYEASVAWAGDRTSVGPQRGWVLVLISANGGLGFCWLPGENPLAVQRDRGFRFGTLTAVHPDDWYPNSRNIKEEDHWWSDPVSGSWVWRWKGFMASYSRAPWAPWTLATVPHWAMAALTAIPPAGGWLMRWRRQRRAPGVCASCGYDLRTTPERCPECGAVAGAA